MHLINMKKNEAYKKLEKSVLLGDLLGTKHFLDKVDNVDYTDEFGRTLVYYAIKENFQEIYVRYSMLVLN